ncbi:PorP/SprF family type IX secretion system membrane protein [Lunatibacter salilacus]|uniref:PorP/SprF family type IX secretion system membrane protein n=1 Tax=Lunatibacter salilacus TaxID=2483804 RepID=UPI00131BAE0F|nr:PorP/SprF family type IX secretion system membrane protein [Lunatibacter salilacus]
MKKQWLLISILFLMGSSVYAQSRKYISQFSHLQQYYNPGLAAYEGSMIRGFIRNQWLGWEGAPKTYFLSAELDFGQLAGETDPGLLGKNAVSLSMHHDTNGAFMDSELILGYASRVRLSRTTNLRLGIGINYNTVRLDGNKMNTQQASDPVVVRYLGSFANMEILDFNLGLALTHKNYYISYAVHNLNGGRLNNGDSFMDGKAVSGIFQGGYRNKLTDNLALATNVMWRNQEDLLDNVEFNFKVLLMDKMWIGAGHRISYANSFQLGFIFGEMRMGYIYEMPMLRSYLLPNTTHEFMLTYSLFRGGSEMIW